MNKTVSALFVILILAASCRAQDDLKLKLIYSCDFDEPSDLEDWTMEGPGIASIRDGKLLIHSKYFDVIDQYYTRAGSSFTGQGGTFYEVLEPAMIRDLGEEEAKKYYYRDTFRGGHLVYWNHFKTPDNYVIECDFQSLSESALHMLMFSGTGDKGQDVFDPSLKKRNGMAAQYTKGDLYNYRISFFAPGRGTSNMRKCPGRILTAKGEDLTLKHPMARHHLKIIKHEDLIEWYINGALSFRFNDEEAYLKGGQTAIRLMAPAKGLYDNYRIYEILD
ncbi:MAG: YesU family protein [Cytophagales bacterium]|nr:YesU family protein [Cytophagales bacterium]